MCLLRGEIIRVFKLTDLQAKCLTSNEESNEIIQHVLNFKVWN